MELTELPMDREAEERLLSAVLKNPVLVFAETITRNFFWYEDNRRIWSAICEAVSEGVENDIIMGDVPWRIEKQYGPVMVHGQPLKRYILDLHFKSVSPETEFGIWAPRVRSAYVRRLVIQASQRLIGQAMDEQNGDVVIRNFSDESSTLANSLSKKRMDIKGIAKDWSDNIERRLLGDGIDATKIPTGVWPIDFLLSGGGTEGRYTVIMAKKKMGKSRLTTRIAYNCAKSGVHVLHFSEEMTNDDMMWLYTAAHTGRSRREYMKPTDGKTPTQIVEMSRTAANEIAELPVAMHCGRVNVRDIVLRTKARKAMAVDSSIVVIVDYLQLVDGRPEDTKEYDRVTYVSKELAALAKATGAWVVALSQPNRCEGMPTPANARSSGQIENDVDEMIIFHRAAEEDEDASPHDKAQGIMWLALNRHGDTFKTPVECDLQRLEFSRHDGYKF